MDRVRDESNGEGSVRVEKPFWLAGGVDRYGGLAPLGFQVIFRLADGRPLATTVAAARRIARIVLKQGRTRGLLAFGAADDHLHALLLISRLLAGAFAHYVETSIRYALRLPVPFEPARILPVRDQKHVYNAFHYVQRQDARHSLGIDLAREMTSLPDLLGMRVVDASICARVRAHLPRIGRPDLIRHFPPNTMEPSNDPVALDLVYDAACAAYALPSLEGRSADVVNARRAAVHVVGPGASTSELATRLNLSVRTIQALRLDPVPAGAVDAVFKQAKLHEALRRVKLGT